MADLLNVLQEKLSGKNVKLYYLKGRRKSFNGSNAITRE